jgi:hypothetical protein
VIGLKAKAIKPANLATTNSVWPAVQGTSGDWFQGGMSGRAAATAGLTEGREYCIPVAFPFDFPLINVGVRPNSSGDAGTPTAVGTTLLRVGVRNASATYRPGSLVADKGTISLTSSNQGGVVATLTDFTAITLSAWTLYYITITQQGAAATPAWISFANIPPIVVPNTAASSNTVIGYYGATATSGALPSSAPAGTITVVNAPGLPMVTLKRGA